MNPRIIYPIPERQSLFYRYLRDIVRIIFLAAAFICLLINFIINGKMWSIVVIWSLFSILRLVFSLRLVEFSIFSHASKVTFYLVVLLFLIDHFLAHGWAETVIPIVLFADLLVMFVIYFAINDRKNRHLMSIFMLGFLNLLFIPYSSHSWPIRNWIAFAFECASFLLFIALLIINRKELLYELKSRFSRKTR